jgi:hypothetical protein
LLQLAGGARPFRRPDGRYSVSIAFDGHQECHDLESPDVVRWLTRCYYESTGWLPSSASLSATIRALAAHADIAGRAEADFVRVGCNASGSSNFVITGEQGSAKSTLARICRLLVDPHSTPLRAEPRDHRDLMVVALHGWVQAYDNLSAMPDWLSNGLCRLVTGGGISTRGLFTNHEVVVWSAHRPSSRRAESSVLRQLIRPAGLERTSARTDQRLGVGLEHED